MCVGMTARACRGAWPSDVNKPARPQLVDDMLIIDDRGGDIGAIIVGMPIYIRNYCGGADCSLGPNYTYRRAPQ